MTLKLREAQAQDSELIIQYIRELAEFERLAQECNPDAASVRKWLFDTPRAGCVLAEWNEEPAGFAVYFYNFSTFLARPGIYIEDLFVRPLYRRKGIARNILNHFAAKAQAEGCGRVEWSVLDWNREAIEFYRSLGAVSMQEWTVQRLDEKALQKLAAEI